LPANGDIDNKIGYSKDSSIIQKKKNWDKSREPYLFKEWHLSNQKGYVSDEFRNISFLAE